MAQQTRKIIKHTVSQGDSLERLAQRFMGDAGAWLQLAILNGLDYPYLSDDTAFLRQIHAAGVATFTRASGSTGNVVIPQGSRVFVPATANTPEKGYTTDLAATILNGTDTITANVTAEQAGEFWNTPGLTITGLGFSVVNLASVANLAPTTGGQILNVKVPGDPLLVFSDSDGVTSTTGVDTQRLKDEKFFAGLLGIDIALNEQGDLFADGRAGIASVAGLANLRDAMLRRFGTPLAWYVFHPGYGSDVERAIGQRGEDYWLQFVRLEVERTVRSDPRVSDVQNLRIKFESGALKIRFDFLCIGERDPQNLVAEIPVLGGA